MDGSQPGAHPAPGAARDLVTIHIPGEPRGKGRPRSALIRKKNGQQFISHYTPADTASFENLVKMEGKLAWGGRPLIEEAVRLQITAIVSVPASWSPKKRARAIAGEIRPTTKPDFDNVTKAVTDALEKVIYRNDARIAEAQIRKWYGATPCLIVKIGLAAGRPPAEVLA
jgi:Holliday junction resolvase RusA-like endonuclease